MRTLLQSTGTRFVAATYRPRSVLFNQGESADSVFYIEKGRVELAVVARNGKEAISSLLGPGDFVGEDALCGRRLRRESARTITPTEALLVSAAQMQALVHAHPTIRDRLTAYIVTRAARLEASLADLLLYPSEQRLARALLVLAGCDPRRPCSCALPPVSQETIAEIIGTTRPRVNLFLGKFKKLGFIEEGDGRLLVKPSLMNLVQAE
jgi:CRP/FNR family transcriptional regulator, cyclic AMP receptor protein